MGSLPSEEYAVIIDFDVDADKSTAFTVPEYCIALGVFIPTFDVAGSVGLEISRDNGSTWYPVLDMATGIDAVIAASGSDPGYVDFSPFLKAIIGRTTSDLRPYKVRFTKSTDEDTDDCTFYVVMSG